MSYASCTTISCIIDNVPELIKPFIDQYIPKHTIKQIMIMSGTCKSVHNVISSHQWFREFNKYKNQLICRRPLFYKNNLSKYDVRNEWEKCLMKKYLIKLCSCNDYDDTILSSILIDHRTDCYNIGYFFLITLHKNNIKVAIKLLSRVEYLNCCYYKTGILIQLINLELYNLIRLWIVKTIYQGSHFYLHNLNGSDFRNIDTNKREKVNEIIKEVNMMISVKIRT
jgi:hypothetical protein